MGASGSKAARNFPKRAEPPAWAGKRTPNASEQPAGVNREQLRDRFASEHRTEAIEKDARDPDFLASLKRLGPVRVDHGMKSVRPEAMSTKELFDSRRKLERELEASGTATTETSSRTYDKFYASTLSQLLDARKGMQDKTQMGAIAERAEVRLDKLESVARFVSSPSVGKGGVRRVLDNDGNEKVVMKAIWVEPVYVDVSTSSAR